jgi:hypothetical protein
MLAARRGAGRPCALRLDEQTGDGPANRPQQNACQIGLTDLLELPVTPLHEIAGTGGSAQKTAQWSTERLQNRPMAPGDLDGA